jgi:M-phase inducer tyrosine phosphatase
METSSPLAAMRPAPPMFGRGHHFTSQSISGIDRFVGLDLRERLHKPRSDYFNVKSVRGSSPAASLAADLSQNFRLDSDSRFVYSQRLVVHPDTHVTDLALAAPGSQHLAERSSQPQT